MRYLCMFILYLYQNQVFNFFGKLHIISYCCIVTSWLWRLTKFKSGLTRETLLQETLVLVVVKASFYVMSK